MFGALRCVALVVGLTTSAWAGPDVEALMFAGRLDEALEGARKTILNALDEK